MRSFAEAPATLSIPRQTGRASSAVEPVREWYTTRISTDDACPGAEGQVGMGKMCWVSGRVQGVYYRSTAAQRARELGVTGYARNLPDGRVEVLACGEESAVHAFIEWLWIGSSASRVTAVEVADAPCDQPPADFRTA